MIKKTFFSIPDKQFKYIRNSFIVIWFLTKYWKPKTNANNGAISSKVVLQIITTVVCTSYLEIYGSAFK